jgi:hypothetical protein
MPWPATPSARCGVVTFRDGAVFAVLALVVKDGAITRLYAVMDSRKPAQVKRVLDQQQ